VTISFQDFLQAIFMMGVKTWPAWVLGGVILVLELMQENKDRQRGKL